MSDDHSLLQRRAKRFCWMQKLLCSLSFALVALGTSYGILSTSGNPNLEVLAPFAAAGAFLGCLLLWPKDFGERIPLLDMTFTGLLIGLTSHPLMMLCYAPFFVIMSTWEIGFGEAISGALVYFLWGTFCSLIGVGWLTVLVGGTAGFIIALIIKLTVNYLSYRQDMNSPPEKLSLEEFNHPYHQAKLKLAQSERRVMGASVALLIIAVISIPLTLFLAEAYREDIERQEVIIQKDAAVEPEMLNE